MKALKATFILLLIFFILSINSCIFCEYPVSACNQQSEAIFDRIQECNKNKIKLNCSVATYDDNLNICSFYKNSDTTLHDEDKYGSEKQKTCLENIKNLSCEDIKELDTIDKILARGIDSCFDFKRKTKKDVCYSNYESYCDNLNGCFDSESICNKLNRDEKIKEYCKNSSNTLITQKDMFSCPYLYDQVSRRCHDIPEELVFDFRDDSWKEDFPKDLCYNKHQVTRQDICYDNYKDYCYANLEICEENLKEPCKSFFNGKNYKKNEYEAKPFDLSKIYEYCSDMENPNMLAKEDDKFLCPNMNNAMMVKCYTEEFVFDFRDDSWKENFPKDLCYNERQKTKQDACYENYYKYINHRIYTCNEDISTYSDLVSGEKKVGRYEAKLYFYCSEAVNAKEEREDSDDLPFRCLEKMSCDEVFDFRKPWKESPLFSDCR